MERTSNPFHVHDIVESNIGHRARVEAIDPSNNHVMFSVRHPRPGLFLAIDAVYGTWQALEVTWHVVETHTERRVA